MDKVTMSDINKGVKQLKKYSFRPSIDSITISRSVYDSMEKEMLEQCKDE